MKSAKKKDDKRNQRRNNKFYFINFCSKLIISFLVLLFRGGKFLNNVRGVGIATGLPFKVFFLVNLKSEGQSGLKIISTPPPPKKKLKLRKNKKYRLKFSSSTDAKVGRGHIATEPKTRKCLLSRNVSF